MLMRTHQLYGLLFLALCTFSCEDAVLDPFSNDGQYYTIYGYLDSLERNHKLRVIPVTRRAQRITGPEAEGSQLDATVRSIDMLTGEVRIWNHSLEQLQDGTYAHIFRSSFIISENVVYRIEVERSDGAMTYAETRVPNIPEKNLIEIEPWNISADSSVVTQKVHLPRIASPWNVQAVYSWGAGPLGPGTDNTRIFAPYGRVGTRTPDGGWDVTMTVSEDQVYVRENMKEAFENFENNGLPRLLVSMGIQVRVLDENWDPPEGIFDPEVLAFPDQVTNVVNGYGFFGSFGLFREEWDACQLSGVLGYASMDTSCGQN